ncbi:probable ubiquitin carboxyl-terminal hydrolase MINDY-4, partial [Alligator sinensis]|uniref:Ubiquitin carboxyl-terminal hydrolase MINDY n=1 Tax=Alligator sinensis TaxID=38654 RepID=A0A3Q0FTM9_ALLSI
MLAAFTNLSTRRVTLTVTQQVLLTYASVIRGGLKKTMATMDQEFPRSALSINNRNELRNVLHIQSLYKENKAKENPLKTTLEMMTNYFLEHFGSVSSIISNSVASLPPNKPSFVSTADYSEDDMRGNTIRSDAFKTEAYRCEIDDLLDKVIPSRRHHQKSEKSNTGISPNSSSFSEGDKKFKNSMEDLKIIRNSEEMKTTMKEKQRSRSSLILRGMMAGPTASSQEDSLKRRPLKQRSSSISSTLQFKGEYSHSSNLPNGDFQESKVTSVQSIGDLCPHNDSAMKADMELSSKTSSGSYRCSATEEIRNIPEDTDDPFAKLLSERERSRVGERKSMPSFDTEPGEKTLKLNMFHRYSGSGREKRERSLKKNESQLPGPRKAPTSISNKGDLMKDALELVDVEDEAAVGEVRKIPDHSTLCTLQVDSKAMDISLAKEIKNLLFGSSLCCFSEEWKIQSFTFNNIPQLKYGIVQKKLESELPAAHTTPDLWGTSVLLSVAAAAPGTPPQQSQRVLPPRIGAPGPPAAQGLRAAYRPATGEGGPCGVLAAVQACVLQELIFGDSGRNSEARVTESQFLISNSEGDNNSLTQKGAVRIKYSEVLKFE